MYPGNLIFSQVMAHLPMQPFDVVCSAIGAITKSKPSPASIPVPGLRPTHLPGKPPGYRKHHKLYHMGIRGGISRNTLAHANQTRDWRIYADFAIPDPHGSTTVSPRFGLELKQTVYVLGKMPTIDLCLSVFLGPLSHHQRGRQTAYLTRPSGQYSHVYPHL